MMRLVPKVTANSLSLGSLCPGWYTPPKMDLRNWRDTCAKRRDLSMGLKCMKFTFRCRSRQLKVLCIPAGETSWAKIANGDP
jgi:hypothetical protein